MNEEMMEKYIERYCRDWREAQVVRERFLLGLRPTEIYARRPAQYEAVADVYRIIENFQARLRSGSGLSPLSVG